jgi:hypothetical protein
VPAGDARISSILVRTKRARLRLSFGGIGIGLKRKFVKQTKIDSGFAHEAGFDQVGLLEAEPDERAGCAGVLWNQRGHAPRFLEAAL